MATGKTVAEAAIDVLEHRRLEREVISAAKAHRRAEVAYWDVLPHQRPASLFTKMQNTRSKLRSAVDALLAFEAEQKK